MFQWAWLLLQLAQRSRCVWLPTLLLSGLVRASLDVSFQYIALCLFLKAKLQWHRASLTKPEASFRAGPWVDREEVADSASSQGQIAGSSAKLRGISRRVAEVTESPSRPVHSIFPGQSMPKGEELKCSCRSSSRTSERSQSETTNWISRSHQIIDCVFHWGRPSEEEAALGKIEDDAWQHKVQCLREGAEVHRQIRQYVQGHLCPGMAVLDIVEMVERAGACLVDFNPGSPLRRGLAFPTGVSINEVAAHDTVNPGDPGKWLQQHDLVKLDFGIHIEGHILDSAFSFAFDAMHDELLRAVQEATNEGIRHAGPDASINDIGARIQEVMEAAEVQWPNGKVLPIKSIKNLTGHTIGPYCIHAGQSLPAIATGTHARMKAGELWAVETFGSVGGVGYVCERGPCSHFMCPPWPPTTLQKRALSKRANRLLTDVIEQQYSTLAFCPRWLEANHCKSASLADSADQDQQWWSEPLAELCRTGIVLEYPPLADVCGSYTAQY